MVLPEQSHVKWHKELVFQETHSLRQQTLSKNKLIALQPKLQ